MCTSLNIILCLSVNKIKDEDCENIGIGLVYLKQLTCLKLDLR